MQQVISMIGSERHDQDEETGKTDPPPGRTYLFNLHTDPQEFAISRAKPRTSRWKHAYAQP